MRIKKSRRKETLNIFIIGIIIVALFLFYLWHHMEGIKLGYKIEQLKKEKEQLKEEIKKLKFEKVNYLGLKRIEKIALEELKLTYPNSDQIIIWDKKILEKQSQSNE